MTLRIAVLGVGRIGKMHAELVARQVPGASLAMVQDINGRAAAERSASEFDVPYTTEVGRSARRRPTSMRWRSAAAPTPTCRS